MAVALALPSPKQLFVVALLHFHRSLWWQCQLLFALTDNVMCKHTLCVCVFLNVDMAAMMRGCVQEPKSGVRFHVRLVNQTGW